MFDFQRLHVYQKAKVFHSDSSRYIEQYDLGKIVNDQLARASMSIVLNIAEGAGRLSHGDKRHFYVMARSSLFECIAIYEILMDRKLLSETEYEIVFANADELSRMLYKMISNLSRKRNP